MSVLGVTSGTDLSCIVCVVAVCLWYGRNWQDSHGGGIYQIASFCLSIHLLDSWTQLCNSDVRNVETGKLLISCCCDTNVNFAWNGYLQYLFL